MNVETGLAAGSVLAGRYQIDTPLGQGGAAVVFRAHDLLTQRDVAVKVLKSAVSAALGTGRFVREIAIAGSLDHPHVLPLLDSGESDGALFYVMPIVPGGTLREKIDRERQLTVDEALRLARGITSALAYAHGQGIVHRDIKPSNVLLDGEKLYIADFGLARAIYRAADDASLTTSGIAIGTPSYMAPEQSTQSEAIDGRADIYAMGCVIYEMLSGDPPFTGSVATTIILRHQSQPVASLRTVRPAVPDWLDAVALRCLEKVPADRFQRAEDLQSALEPSGLRDFGMPARRGLFRWSGRAALALAALLATVWAGRSVWQSRDSTTTLNDTTRIAVLPTEGAISQELTGLHDRLGDGFARWNGVSVADRKRVSELAGRRLSNKQAAQIASRLGAGRFVRLEVGRFSDSVRLRAGLYNTEGSVLIHEASASAPYGSVADSVLFRLADSLLFRGRAIGGGSQSQNATRSAPALQGYINGRALVGSWDLEPADRAFVQAVAADSGYADALLWLALTRSWRGLAPSQWRFHAERALAARSRLTTRDAALAAALAAQARNEFATACPSFLRLAQDLETEFAPWYSAAACVDADPGVVRTRASSTGWAFRSSYQQAVTAWRRAFDILPAIYRDYRNVEAKRRAWHLWVSPNQAREGYAVPPDTGTFLAIPTWEGDSLAFVPRPARDFSAGLVLMSREATIALQRQRQSFLQLATEWVAVAPANYEAREALGVAMWMSGNDAAIDTIQSASRMARAPPDRARLGLTEALMLLLKQAPDSQSARRVQRLADSLLKAREPDWDRGVVATLAALTGRASLAAGAWRTPSPRIQWRLPPIAVGKGLALLVFASAGGPRDSLIALESDLARAVASAPVAEQLDLRMEWIGRPAALAYPMLAMPSLPGLAGHGDYLLDAIAAHMRADSASVRAVLARVLATRAWVRPADISFEALVPEGMLLATSGAPRLAAALLDSTLSQLDQAPIRSLMNPIAMFLMLRGFALRAELSAQLGDGVGRPWAGVLARLWVAPDSFLSTVHDRMRTLERGTPP